MSKESEKNKEIPGCRISSSRVPFLECQAHLVPCGTAVFGRAEPFVYKAKGGIVMDEAVLTGQNQALAAFFTGCIDGGV